MEARDRRDGKFAPARTPARAEAAES